MAGFSLQESTSSCRYMAGMDQGTMSIVRGAKYLR